MPPMHAAAVFLADTLDWLNLWHSDPGDMPDEHPHVESNHLFPRP